MIIEALNEYVARHAKDMGDRSRHVGASEIGLCIRRTWYSKKGGVPVEGSWGGHVRGTTMEEAFWQPAMKEKYGDRLLYSGPEQRSLRKGKLSATPDGILTGLKRNALAYLGVKDIKSSCILVECKTIDPRVNLQEAKAENTFQVQVQLGLVRALTKHKPEYALITYTDASFWDEVDEFAIRFDPQVFAAAEARAAKIFGATRADEVPPEGWIAGGHECEWCPFAKECGHERRRVPDRELAPLDPQFLAEMEDLCREARGLQAEGEAKLAEFRAKQDEIKTRLRDKSIRKVAGVVTWSSVRGRVSIDQPKLQERLAEMGINIADYQKQGDPSDRLQILL